MNFWLGVAMICLVLVTFLWVASLFAPRRDKYTVGELNEIKSRVWADGYESGWDDHTAGKKSQLLP